MSKGTSMNIEAFSRSKYKNSTKPGDDVILIEPDQVLAVFDGATDPTGAFYNGESSGRIAARSAARCVADMLARGTLDETPAEMIFQEISTSVKTAAQEHNVAHPASTTAALAVKCGDMYRILALGDTGVRLNGTKVLQHHKIIDTVSTAARIQVHKTLSPRMDESDDVEFATRQTIFLGLEAAIETGKLTRQEAELAMEAATQASGLPQSVIAEFLSGGIRTQFHYANADHLLGFASLNGGQVIANGMTDLTIPAAELESIEIFSDGYISIPTSGIRCADWEAEFTRVETEDFHKTGTFPAVKGSTSSETCDDRTVISAGI